MKQNGRILLAWLLVCLLALPLLGMGAAAPQAAKPTKTPKSVTAGGNAYDVIAAVNQVRAANGLPAFQPNGALMAAAQAHSSWMASVGSISHTGQGGSDVKSRALAAGYGGGASVSVIENIYGGMNASVGTAVGWWQGDSLHLNTLLSSRHTEVGAGVATGSNGVVYYTLDVGVVSGSAPPSGGNTGGSTNPGTTPQAPGAAATPVAAVVAFNPVQKAQAGPDGSIVHTVEAGQTLWTIAATYAVSLADLYRLNGFTDQTLIHPGQKVVVRPAGAAETVSSPAPQTGAEQTPAAGAAASPSPYPTVDRPATATVAAALALAQTPAESTSQPAQSPGSLIKRIGAKIDPLLVLIAGLLLAGAGLFLFGNLLKRAG